MKKLKSILFVSIAAVCLSSCTNWLNLKPFDLTLDDELYSTEEGINEALNGLYLNMANSNLYGKNLTYYTVELMGQRYCFKSSLNINNLEMTDLPFFDYTKNQSVRTHLDGIFTKAYNLIRDVNYFIDKVEDTKVVTDDKRDILLGESHALRAFLHFDMLRLYGYPPVLDSKGSGIPYYTEATPDWQPIKNNGEVIALVLKDIDTALGYLDEDPILTPNVTIEQYQDIFYKAYRNHRLNYYAVKALKARVLCYAGDAKSVEAAAKLAKELIESEGFQNTFPWGTNTGGDNIYLDEVMFGIHVTSMYSDYSRWFNTSASDAFSSVLPTTTNTLVYMYDTGSEAYNVGTKDQRTRLWPTMAIDENIHLASKFALNTNANSDLLFFQPLIRKSELYLIAAEYFEDVSYVDEIRLHRGMKALDETDNIAGYDLQEQICKEYMKDFVSEGQLFFYYKRRAEKKIWGNVGSSQPEMGMLNVTNPGVSYVPPMPKKETEI